MAVQQTMVGPNRRASGAQTTPRSESDIRIDLVRPNRVIAAANSIGTPDAQSQFSSATDGDTWQQSTLPHVEGDNLHADPTVGWTSNGTAWAVTIGIQGGDLRLRAYRSTDGGSTWTFDATVSGTQTGADKELMWVDGSPTSQFRNQIYVIWHDDQPAYLNRRTWPAGAWQTPVQISGVETTGTAIGGDIATNGAGEVFAFWPDTGSRRLLVARSTNGGATFGTPTIIATTFAAYEISLPAFDIRKALIYLSGAAYRDAANNFVYAVWTDLTGASGCTSSGDEPDTDSGCTCKTRIWFSRSMNGGTTWQPPTMINNLTARTDQFNPRLAVDDTDGTLAVTYYDTVGDPTRRQTNLWYQSSPDNGETWSAPFKITSVSTDETTAGANINQYGDYNGLSGYAGIFFPSWTDRRSGGREEVWTARTIPDSVTDYILTALI